MELSIDTHEALYRQVWCQYIGPNISESICLSCEISVITPFTFECAFVKSLINGGEIAIENILPLCLHCYGCLGINEDIEIFMKENCLPGYKMFQKTKISDNLVVDKQDENILKKEDSTNTGLL